ncbi:MAG: glucose-6-phosphate isomerase, partial [Porticoccaceae bacterium]|nr:glucose-6-phosphate isomerase [Porticoccaceae bacterium]
ASDVYKRQAGITGQDIAQHFVAATNHLAGAVALGISAERIFPVEDWVGGRFSLWSAIGLPIAISLGPEVFKQVLSGAHEMDKHFFTTPFEHNLPVVHGLQAIWHINFRNYKSRAVLPYVHKLRGLPNYLQQLVMESLGKSTTKEGLSIPYPTGQVIWGSEGTNGQHSLHQLLLQGTETASIDFITTRTAHCEATTHQQLLSNCLAQSKALMQGKSIAQAYEELLTKGASEDQAQLLAKHHAVPGNRPSNTLLLDELRPHSLGSLLAFYEHSVYVQSVVWNINAFDQWGVELGKKMSNELFSLLNDPESNPSTYDQLDSSTRTLLACLHKPAGHLNKS